ncbi:MAG TPA: histidine kinase N-terminal domain-containing protein [Propionibacteriaceae bacterium]|nr:histidine kinase N-terminal domain-containing protein [Propionibacteriaceae bacterium]HPZ50366.1 histidine kinase N-terminal domain-containing protein [Propionibacteriaceae bacterium]
MLTLEQVVAEQTDLSTTDLETLQRLVADWHLLADLSFSDLICWVPGRDDNEFFAVAQIRPATGPTALEDDVVGEVISYDSEHLVTEAYLSEVICETSDNKLQAGIPVDVWAIPVMRDGRCLAVVERHTNQMGVRAPGELEDNYHEIADILSDMLWRGDFPDGHDRSTGSPRVGEGIIRVDEAGIVVYASPNAVSAYRRLGLTGDLVGEPIIRTTTELIGSNPVDEAAERKLSSNRSLEIDVETDRASLRLRVLPLTDEDGRIGTLLVCRDTTELRYRDRQLVTKDATIREIHHRVKNNLQTVAALLRLQARRMTSPEGAAALQDAMGRVQAIAVVHEILSQSLAGTVEFDDIVDRLLRHVGDVAASRGKVHTIRNGSFGEVPAAAATSLSLIITELCQNAVEHGFASGSGTVTVTPRRERGRLIVEVADDGAGLPEGFQLGGSARTSLGLSIVTTLVSDLHGTFTLRNNEGGGSTAVVEIPVS